MTTALILFAHGARNPDWARPFERLRAMVQQQTPQTLVRLAYLEQMEPSLEHAIAELTSSGCNSAVIVPLFLAQGGHVLRDLSHKIHQLQQRYPQLHLTHSVAVGEDEQILNAICTFCLSQLVAN